MLSIFLCARWLPLVNLLCRNVDSSLLSILSLGCLSFCSISSTFVISFCGALASLIVSVTTCRGEGAHTLNQPPLWALGASSFHSPCHSFLFCTMRTWSSPPTLALKIGGHVGEMHIPVPSLGRSLRDDETSISVIFTSLLDLICSSRRSPWHILPL